MIISDNWQVDDLYIHDEMYLVEADEEGNQEDEDKPGIFESLLNLIIVVGYVRN